MILCLRKLKILDLSLKELTIELGKKDTNVHCAWFSHSCSYFKDCSLVCVCFRPLIGIHLGRSFDLRKDARELRGLHVLRSAAPHRTFTAYQPNPWSRLVVRVLTKCPLSWISKRKEIAFTLDNASVHNEWKFVTPCTWVWWRNYIIIQ